MLPSTLHFVQ